MTDSLINWFTTNLDGLPKELIVFIISMVPILELRGGFVAAALLKIPYLQAVPICIIGNIIPIRKYEFLGLLLFVGIPLPGTGAWTGSLIACLLDVKMKKAVPAIFLGLILATLIMSFITYVMPYLISLI